MTGNNLRYSILLGVDSLFAGTSPGYNDRQMMAIINKAQRRVFRDKVRLFDSSEKIKRMLAPVTKRGSYRDQGNATQKIALTSDTTIIDYPHTITGYTVGVFMTLPLDANFLVEESARLTSSTYVDIVLPITYDYFNKNYKNRYKKPSIELIWRLDAKLESLRPVVELILPDGSTVYDYLITYLKYPTDLIVDTTTPGNSVECEIVDPSFSDEIVGEAIKIITASLNDASYEIEAAEKKFDEN